MKLTLAFALALFLVAPVDAGARQPAGAGQNSAPAAARSESSELVEAARLSTEVVRLYSEKKFGEAQPLAERALALREKALGPDHGLVGRALLNLAAIQTGREKYKQAEESYRRAAAIFERGGTKKQLIEARRQLGALLLRRGEHAGAKPLLASVVSLGEGGEGDRDGLAYALNLLTQVHLLEGEAELAAQTWHRALTIWRELYGKDDERVQGFEDSMACLLVRTLGYPRSVEFNERLSELEMQARGVDLTAGGLINGKAIKKPHPDYPDMARAQRVQGTVVVRITVDETGKVTSAKAICGPKQLGPPSEQAARRALFEPTQLDGRPVKVTGVITYNYVLQ
jgi:TonB family protein